MQLFWDRGYAASSMEELVARTGLHRAALYGAHGSKQRLYEAALRRYLERVAGPRAAPLAPLDASLPALEAWLLRAGESAAGPEGRRGCLLAVAAAEAPRPATVGRIVEAWLGELRSRVARALRNAQLRGELLGAVEVGPLADALCGSHLGLWALARSPAPRPAVASCAAGLRAWLGSLRSGSPGA